MMQDIVIASLSMARESLVYAEAAAKHLRRNGFKTPSITGGIQPRKFKVEEFDPIALDVDGKHVYLFAVPTNPADILHKITPGEMKSRAEFAATAAKENGATYVTLVAPDLFFGRADKGLRDLPEDAPAEKRALFKGKGNLAKAQARAFHVNGIDRIVTMHLHSPEIARSYQEVYGRDDALVEISPAPLLVYYVIRDSMINLEDKGRSLVVARLDKGADAFYHEIYNALHGLGYTNVSGMMFDKTRKKPNDPSKVEVVNPRFTENFDGLEGKIVLAPDDIDDTCGSKTALFNTLLKEGIDCNGRIERPAGVFSYSTHPALAGLGFEGALQLLNSSDPVEVVYTNTHPFIEQSIPIDLLGKTSIIRTARYIGEVIKHLEFGTPIQGCCYTEGRMDLEKIGKYMMAPVRDFSHPKYRAESREQVQ